MKRIVSISEEGAAVVESGLSVRQAHEIRTGCNPDQLCNECLRAIGELPSGGNGPSAATG